LKWSAADGVTLHEARVCAGLENIAILGGAGRTADRPVTGDLNLMAALGELVDGRVWKASFQGEVARIPFARVK